MLVCKPRITRTKKHQSVLCVCSGSLGRLKHQWVLGACSGSVGRHKHQALPGFAQDPWAELNICGFFFTCSRLMAELNINVYLVFVQDLWAELSINVCSACSGFFLHVQDPWPNLASMGAWCLIPRTNKAPIGILCLFRIFGLIYA